MAACTHNNDTQGNVMRAKDWAVILVGFGLLAGLGVGAVAYHQNKENEQAAYERMMLRMYHAEGEYLQRILDERKNNRATPERIRTKDQIRTDLVRELISQGGQADAAVEAAEEAATRAINSALEEREAARGEIERTKLEANN